MENEDHSEVGNTQTTLENLGENTPSFPCINNEEKISMSYNPIPNKNYQIHNTDCLKENENGTMDISEIVKIGNVLFNNVKDPYQMLYFSAINQSEHDLNISNNDTELKPKMTESSQEEIITI